jgi:ABC-type amino acid transport system permease subunit
VATAQFFPTFAGAAAIYLCMTLPTGWAIGALERRVAVKR